jgi:methylated-DNA-[protein]-cysteine S-methyltransferase
MHDAGHCRFPTPIGQCAIAWGPAGLRCVALPGFPEVRLRRHAAARADPPPEVEAVIAGIGELFSGGRPDFAAVRLDDADLPAFDARVLAAARRIPPGRTRSYGEIAAELGDPMLARGVGQALARNRWAIVVPCHRVLAADGRPGGFSAAGGVATKFRILELEGALAGGPPSLFGALPFQAAPRRG